MKPLRYSAPDDPNAFDWQETDEDPSEPPTEDLLLENPFCITLPAEIILEIVRFAASDGLWTSMFDKERTRWLQDLTTLAKDWRAAAQRVLYSQVILHLLAPDDLCETKQIANLQYLEQHPELAQYVQMFYILSTKLDPEKICRIPAVFPNITFIHLALPVWSVRMQPEHITRMLASIPFIRSLVLEYGDELDYPPSAVPDFPPIGLASVKLIGTGARLAHLVVALANSASASTLRKLELGIHSANGKALKAVVLWTGAFEELRILRINLGGGQQYYNELIDQGKLDSMLVGRTPDHVK
jgi:hypothetical protein